MKVLVYQKVLVMLVLFLMTKTPAHANLIQGTDPNFGPNSLTIDTSTGLAWLNVNASAGLSYNQVLADTHPGGIYSGFTIATVPEIITLLSDAGIPGIGDYPLSNPSIPSFISLLGPTGVYDRYPGILGLSSTSEGGDLQNVVQIYVAGFNGTPEYSVTGGPGYGGDGLAINQNVSGPGTWLVMSVPEPSNQIIYILAAASLLVFSCFVRKTHCSPNPGERIRW